MAINGLSVLAVIPARSGSKRCPGKNFRLFRGKTLYLWSCEAAALSKYIDMTVLSRDENRPPELCTDEAMNEDVLRYHLKEHPHDLVVLLQPTSPLRTAADIDACIEMVALRVRSSCCISYNKETGRKNGAVYVARRKWIEKNDFHITGKRYWMPADRSLDIDYEADFSK